MKTRYASLLLLAALPVSVVAAPKAASPKGGATPADLAGAWLWATVSGVNYEDANTGRTMEPSGMARRFAFIRDGRYKSLSYIRVRTYSLLSESSTTEEGTVTFRGNTFTLHPSHGHYKGHIGSRVTDRDMKPAERKVETYAWEWRTEDGKRRLYIGKPGEEMSRYDSVR